MKKGALVGLFVAAFTLMFSGLALAASSPIVNGSFQTGDFTGWSPFDSTHCRFGVCGDGTAAVQHCTPGAPGDIDGYCAVFSGNYVSAGQNAGTTTAHQYTIGACMKHSGTGQSNVYGPVPFSISGDTGWVCQTKTFFNRYGSIQRFAPLSMNNSGGTDYFDQFTFTVNQP